MLFCKDSQRVRQAFLIFLPTIFFVLSVKATSLSSVWTFIKMLMRLGEFSKNFHVSLRRLSIFTMYLILSPVSAHARANLLQIQWKLRRTLLTRFNLASTPLCSPVMTLAPSLTNDFKFLTSKSHSFNVSNIWLVITSAFAPRGSSMHLVARNSV